MESPRVSLDGFRHHLQASSSWLRPSSGHDSISVAVIYIGSALAKTASELYTTSTSPGPEKVVHRLRSLQSVSNPCL